MTGGKRLALVGLGFLSCHCHLERGLKMRALFVFMPAVLPMAYQLLTVGTARGQAGLGRRAYIRSCSLGISSAHAVRGGIAAPPPGDALSPVVTGSPLATSVSFPGRPVPWLAWRLKPSWEGLGPLHHRPRSEQGLSLAARQGCGSCCTSWRAHVPLDECGQGGAHDALWLPP